MSGMSDVQCVSTQDVSLLRQFLRQFPLDAAYFLGDLQEPFFSHCRWYVALFRGQPQAVILLYEGLSTPTLLSFGAPDLIAELLRCYAHILPSAGYAKVPHAHLSAFAQHCEFHDIDNMWCMGLTASSISLDMDSSNFSCVAKEERIVRQLLPSDSIESILAVFQDYSGHFFEPPQLQSGVYYGSFLQNKLCCVVGTHVYAPQERVAVLGNIVTAKPVRKQGHAQACIAALVADLCQRGCSFISLHVSDQNSSAIHCYRRVGFLFRSTLIDAPFRGMR